MGPGHRRDTIDDHLGARNWKKICGLGVLLRRRKSEAIKEMRRHHDEFERFTRSQPRDRVDAWKSMVMDWQEGRSDVNPFSRTTKGETEHDVRLRLAEKEAEEMRKGSTPVHDVSPSSFMMLGLEVEEQQRQLALHLSEHDASTSRLKTEVLERRAKLGRAISRFRKLQQTYTPIALTYLASLRNVGSDTPAEKMPLVLPSSLPEGMRFQPGMLQWLMMEAEFRRAQLWSELAGEQLHLLALKGAEGFQK
ncbi:hypothetical protein MPER_10369, partial [Moniliophthora perniciosa FA553]